MGSYQIQGRGAPGEGLQDQAGQQPGCRAEGCLSASLAPQPLNSVDGEVVLLLKALKATGEVNLITATGTGTYADGEAHYRWPRTQRGVMVSRGKYRIWCPLFPYTQCASLKISIHIYLHTCL